jgi:hypothetical protein
MEHRWSERRAANTVVLMNTRPHGLLRGHIQNVSRDGVFVRLPDASALDQVFHVELVFVRSAAGVTRILRVPARVVHVGDDGAGLMFNDAVHAGLHRLMTA